MERERRTINDAAAADLVIPVTAIAFTLYFFSTIANSPWTAQVNAFLIGGILIALCLGLVGRTALAIRRRDAALGWGRLVSIDDLASGRVGLLLATIAYISLIDWAGFTLTTFGFLIVAMAILSRGRHLKAIVPVSAALALGGWALFIWAFDTRFPRGPFEDLMRTVTGNG